MDYHCNWTKHASKYISSFSKERLTGVTVAECKAACCKARTFQCKSFDYNVNTNICDLSEETIASQGFTTSSGTYDNYEVKPNPKPEAAQMWTLSERGDGTFFVASHLGNYLEVYDPTFFEYTDTAGEDRKWTIANSSGTPPCAGDSCHDGIRNQDEKQIDCGGDNCEACGPWMGDSTSECHLYGNLVHHKGETVGNMCCDSIKVGLPGFAGDAAGAAESHANALNCADDCLKLWKHVLVNMAAILNSEPIFDSLPTVEARCQELTGSVSRQPAPNGTTAVPETRVGCGWIPATICDIIQWHRASTLVRLRAVLLLYVTYFPATVFSFLL